MTDTTDTAHTTDPAPRDTIAGLTVEIDQRLVGRAAQDALIAALRASGFDLEPEDHLTLDAATDLVLDGTDAYQQGFKLLTALSDLETRIRTHHTRFRVPLNTLIHVVRDMEATVGQPVAAAKKTLSTRLGQWKAEQDRLDRQRAQETQRAADAAAQAAHAARAATMERLAEAEPDVQLAAIFRQDAEAMATVPVLAPPVAVAPSAPKITGGYVRSGFDAEVTDVRALLRAWLDGQCSLPEDDLVKGIQSYLNKQATSLGDALSAAYPGVRAIPTHTAVAVRRKTTTD